MLNNQLRNCLTALPLKMMNSFSTLAVLKFGNKNVRVMLLYFALFFIKKKDSKCYHSFQIKNRLPLKYLSVALAKTTLRDHGNDP